MSSNLPPGVSENMIPGNRPEDAAWEFFHESVDEDCIKEGFTDMDAHIIWGIGFEVFKHLRKYGAKFPHDSL